MFLVALLLPQDGMHKIWLTKATLTTLNPMEELSANGLLILDTTPEQKILPLALIPEKDLSACGKTLLGIIEICYLAAQALESGWLLVDLTEFFGQTTTEATHLTT